MESVTYTVMAATENQHVKALLVSQPHQKVPTRTRNTKKGSRDGEWVRPAKPNKTSCFRRTENSVA